MISELPKTQTKTINGTVAQPSVSVTSTPTINLLDTEALRIKLQSLSLPKQRSARISESNDALLKAVQERKDKGEDFSDLTEKIFEANRPSMYWLAKQITIKFDLNSDYATELGARLLLAGWQVCTACVQNYDPSREKKFGSYLFDSLKKKFAGITAEFFQEKTANQAVSLDYSKGDERGDGASLSTKIPDKNAPCPVTEAIRNEYPAIVITALGKLPPAFPLSTFPLSPAELLSMRYGITWQGQPHQVTAPQGITKYLHTNCNAQRINTTEVIGRINQAKRLLKPILDAKMSQ